MAVTISWTCACGKQVSSPANRVGRRYVCPVCSQAGTVPKDGMWSAPPVPLSASRRASGLLAVSLAFVLGLQSVSLYAREGDLETSLVAMGAEIAAAAAAALHLMRRRAA